MASDKEVIYTNSARERIDLIHDRLDSKIEDALRDKEFIPGESVIEVTASDVEEISRSMKISFHGVQERKSLYKKSIVYTYFIIGIVMLFSGLFYEEIRNIIDNPIRASLIGSGIIITIASIYLNYYFELRSEE